MMDGIRGGGTAELGKVAHARRVALRRRQDGPVFAPPDDVAAADPAPAPPAAAGLGAIGLLALQEQVGGAAADSAACTHAGLLLAGLARLQHRLLSGAAAPPDDLRLLGRLCDDAPCAADPGLRSLTAAIGLRVRIELARRQAPPAAR